MNVSELLDQTVAYFMGSGSSRFNSQVPASFYAVTIEENTGETPEVCSDKRNL